MAPRQRPAANHAALIEQVYAAALDRRRWSDALVGIADHLSSAGATLEIVDKATLAPIIFEGARLPDSGIEDYVAHYAHRNPRLMRAREAPAGHIAHDLAILSETEMDCHPFYADFLGRDGFRYAVLGMLQNNERWFSLVSTQRLKSQGCIEQPDVEALRRLLPHVRQAVDVQLRLASAVQDSIGLTEAFDRLSDGVILLDRSARVLFANRAASAILTGGGLRLVDNQLQPDCASAVSKLGRTLQRMLHVASNDDGSAGGEVLVPRADGAPPFLLAMRRLPRPESIETELLADYALPAAIVFIKDPQPASAVERILRSVFKLTPAEVMLAVAIYRGHTVTEYAARHRISRATARSHLARIMRKTSTHRQADLIRFIGSIDLPLS